MAPAGMMTMTVRLRRSKSSARCKPRLIATVANDATTPASVITTSAPMPRRSVESEVLGYAVMASGRSRSSRATWRLAASTWEGLGGRRGVQAPAASFAEEDQREAPDARRNHDGRLEPDSRALCRIEPD